ncbi:aldehyde dehydrogenase family protein [Byssothecium circinans]|uniref:Aldehyde dehydrogenase family protein n=1 Tax=Byssothecium circinans TaxID=147558 RepID=A0A6A5THQ7_9PLEO|nr:aldehyde dehydrogenase family protein [Byssothecium circinans]
MADTNTVPLLINGEDISHTSTFDVISPASGEACWKAVSATSEDAVKAAVLLKAADILEQNVGEYAGYMMTEMGADVGSAQFFVLPLAIAMCRDIAGRIASVCGSVPIVAKEGQSAMVWKEPYGVCLSVVAWNAPYVFGVRAAATAIAAGNTTVIKSSEMTPRCYYALGKVFKEAGLPDGVFNVIGCRPQDAPLVVNTMIEHPAVKKINFTGSAATGRKIARTCGENLKPILMELGGKNSATVLDDADLDKASVECLAGAFLNGGQICMGTDRVVAHHSIAPALIEKMKHQLAAFAKQSHILPYVVSSASKLRLARLVSEALDQGAELIAGDSTQSSPAASFIPTILSSVKDTSKVYHEEAFGPLVSISTFETEDDAVSFANATLYGLHAAVFTRDLKRGLSVAKKLEVGAVHINTMTVHDEPALPMGGVKGEGWGRFNAREGLEEFLVSKAVTWDDDYGS